jgi:hypothetical protein
MQVIIAWISFSFEDNQTEGRQGAAVCPNSVLGRLSACVGCGTNIGCAATTARQQPHPKTRPHPACLAHHLTAPLSSFVLDVETTYARVSEPHDQESLPLCRNRLGMIL